MANNFKVHDLIADNIYVSENNGNVILSSGNQSISGIKVFTQAPTFSNTTVRDSFILNSLGASENADPETLVVRSNVGNSIFNSVISKVGLDSANYNYNNINYTIDGEPTVVYTYDFPLADGTIALDTTAVMLQGNQTISGIKTFATGVNISGNVGIGTSSPAVPLHISPVDGVSLRLGQDGTAGRLEFGNINVAINRTSSQLALQGFDGFTFGTQNGERMRITSTGNVGIGTTTPYSKLHIAGSPALANTTMEDILYLQRPYNAGISFGQRAVFRLGRYTTESKSATRLDIGLRENADDTTISTSPEVTIMTLRADRKVGIGTTTPNGTLDVNGTGIFRSGIISSGNVNINGNLTISGVYNIYQQIENAKILSIAYAIAL